jgi:CRP/FNR family cyclic AMP-dependent transcriptional regulator
MDRSAHPPADTDMREHAAHLLIAAAPMAHMAAHEARVVVDAMRPLHLLPDTLLFEEGDAAGHDYMALVLEGQVRAVAGTGLPGGELVISVVGPGGLVGEMSVIDGAPRSASCTTLTEVKLGILSRAALFTLFDTHPVVAARLMLGLCKGLADRLRDSNRRLRTLSQLSRALQSELDAVHAVNRRLLDARHP